MLADFFVADSADAVRYARRIEEADEGEEIERRLKPVHYKNITAFEIASLWAILDDSDGDVKHHMPETVYLGEDSESWLHRFPAELSTLLASLDEAGLKSAAQDWAETEELDCDPEELAPLLADLQALARQAAVSGKALYLWGCL